MEVHTLAASICEPLSPLASANRIRDSGCTWSRGSPPALGAAAAAGAAAARGCVVAGAAAGAAVGADAAAGAGAAARDRLLDVLTPDPSADTGARDPRQVEAVLRGEPADQRGQRRAALGAV